MRGSEIEHNFYKTGLASMFGLISKALTQVRFQQLAQNFLIRAGIDLATIDGWASASITTAVREELEVRRNSLARHVQTTDIEIQILYSMKLYESGLLNNEQSQRLLELIKKTASPTNISHSGQFSKKVGDWLGNKRNY